ncbi:dephospho-CoA kinase [Bacillus timonensis]|nr:dephospho-CoA kinase [Bacillus timonensis]
MTVVIGLTGGIASGKSTVSTMLQELGFVIIDADMIARKVVEPGEIAYRQIVEAFGESILLETKEIDRVKLGGIIFHNEDKRKLLNSIVHPAVRKAMIDEKEKYIINGEQLIVLDIPLLFESKLTHLVNKALLIYVNFETQLNRLMKRNDLSEEEARARISSQMPLKDKCKLADEVIDNNGTLEKTRQQLHNLLNKWGIQVRNTDF